MFACKKFPASNSWNWGKTLMICDQDRHQNLKLWTPLHVCMQKISRLWYLVHVEKFCVYTCATWCVCLVCEWCVCVGGEFVWVCVSLCMSGCPCFWVVCRPSTRWRQLGHALTTQHHTSNPTWATTSTRRQTDLTHVHLCLSPQIYLNFHHHSCLKHHHNVQIRDWVDVFQTVKTCDASATTRTWGVFTLGDARSLFQKFYHWDSC